MGAMGGADDDDIAWYQGSVASIVTGEEPATARIKPTQGTSQPRLVDKGEIARGGMGSVRLVHDTLIRRHTALKLLDGPDRDDGRVRFIREAQIMGQLDHPNIVSVYDLGLTADGVPTFTMKLVVGETLSKHLQENDVAGNERALERVLSILVKVCDAVSFAHSRGVVHRDLKPDNIMIGSFGQVYVMDWGCACVLTEEQLARVSNADAEHRVRVDHVPDLDAPGTVIGTGTHMSPEQAWGKTNEVDERTDVFGLGAILYQVLTRVPPYRGRTPVETIRRAQKCEIVEPRDRTPRRDLPRALCRIAMKAMTSDPHGRHPSVLAFQEELEQFLRGGSWFATQRFPAGAQIIREGDAAVAAYIITSGQCEVYKTEGGRRVKLRTLGPGDVFGEIALFTGEVRLASVDALEPVTATVITREALADELSMDSWMGAFVRAMAGRFRDLDEKLSALRREQGKTNVQEQDER
jgi:serine/threonine-protein kinase